MVFFIYEYNYLLIVMKGNIINLICINEKIVNVYIIMYDKIVFNIYFMYDFYIRIICVYGGELMVRIVDGEMFGFMCVGMNLF